MSSFQERQTEELKLLLNNLIIQRDALEAEAEALHIELHSHGINGEPPAGVKASLVDSEGFPRNDIDIAAVLNKRKRLAEINTDHRDIMKRIEDSMHKLHSLLPYAPEIEEVKPESHTDQKIDKERETTPLKPLAKLDQVLEGSPAAEAGIFENDLLVMFGTITSEDSNFLGQIAQLVGNSANKAIPIKVMRSIEGVHTYIDLQVTPKPWGGRGLLGCHLTPLPNS